MSKRYEHINNFGPVKKLKLDVRVNHRGPSTTTSNIVDFGDDEDDEVLLLATQLAEENQSKSKGTQNTECEFSFSKFVPQVHGTTSTQQILVEPMSSSRQHTNIIMDEMEEIFGTDETFVFLPNSSIEQKTSFEDLGTNSTSKLSDCVLSRAKANRCQLAQERQLKFLMERVDVLKKANTQLQKDLNDSKNQAGTKDGEVNLLRNELRQARKLLQDSKIKKLALAEKVEKDCNKKITEAYKQVLAKNAELNLSNIEISELKIRSAKNIERKQFKENRASATTNCDKNRNLLRMDNLCISSSPKRTTTKIPGHVYEYEKDTGGQKKCSFLEMELEQLLLHYTEVQLQSSTVETTAGIVTSVCRVFMEFRSYAQSLKFKKNCMLYSHHHFDLRTDDAIFMRTSLTQPEVLYDLERAVLLRRYIATLALICKKQSSISKALLQKKHSKHFIIQIAIEAITTLSFSFEVSAHVGVFEAIGALLHSLLGHINSVNMSETELELLFELLKQLVFTRPTPWVFRELSACMLLCTRENQLLAKMCINSPSNCFVSDRVRSVYRFNPRSCLIQVYSGLIELCFCSHLLFQPSHFKLLLSICGNHVRFVYQCFLSTPEFILKMFPFQSFADDEKEDNEEVIFKVVSSHFDKKLQDDTRPTTYESTLTSRNVSNVTSTVTQDQMSTERGCECYVKLCLSVVTLVFQMMYQWILQDKKSDILEIGDISQISVHLLTLIFREYYLTCLFRDSEESTKHYLSLLCSWWKDNSQVLRFDDTHMRFLKQLQELHFMLKPLHQEENSGNSNSDLLEWKRNVNNVDVNTQKYNQLNVAFNSETLFTHTSSDFFRGLKRIVYHFD